MRWLRAFLLLGLLSSVACSAEPRLTDLEEAVRAGDERNGDLQFTLQGQPGEEITLDISELSGVESNIEMFRLLLHVADRLDAQDGGRTRLLLSSFGEDRVIVPAEEIQRLGAAFPDENPMYLLRTFPQHVQDLNGQSLFPERRGGLLAVSRLQMEDFGEFGRIWITDPYLERQAPQDPIHYRDEEAF